MSVLFLALLVRLSGIASRPIWYDEAFSILFSEKGPDAILTGTLSPDPEGSSADIHPPGYYFLLWGWIQNFGPSVVSVRSLSVLAGLGVVAMIYLLGIKLFDQRVGLTASLLGTLLPFQIHYAQEIRMYVFTTLFISLAAYAFWQAKQTGRFGWWILFVFSAAAAQYTHNLAAIFLIALALIPIFQRDWKSARSVALAGLAVILLYLPWLLQLPAQFANIERGYWIQIPGVERFFTLFLLYLPNLPVQESWLALMLLISLSIIALGGYQTAIAAGASKPRNAAWLAYLSFVPPIMLWLISQFRPVYLERIFLVSHAFFCLWLAWALFNTRLPRLVFGFSLVLLTFGIGYGFFRHVANTHFPYAPFSELDAYLRSEIRPGDLILHSNKLSLLPAIYYDRALPQAYIEDSPGGQTDTLAPATRHVLGITAFADMDHAAENVSRIWFIIFQQSIDEYIRAGYPTHEHLEYLNEHYHLQSMTRWNDLILYLYD